MPADSGLTLKARCSGAHTCHHPGGAEGWNHCGAHAGKGPWTEDIAKHMKEEENWEKLCKKDQKDLTTGWVC